jgi:hypothetical protein
MYWFLLAMGLSPIAFMWFCIRKLDKEEKEKKARVFKARRQSNDTD